MNVVSAQVYQLFLTELQRHLERAHAELMDGPAPSPEEARELGRTFHTIRGGAGFLGIDTVASPAAVLDDLLRKSSERIEHNLGKVREVLTELEAAAAALPDAQREPKGA